MTESWHDTIVLGTAQLGMSYGIANTTGRPSEEQALTLLQSAAAAGLRTFDTAWGYGDSETLLGRLLPRIYRPDTVRLITKFSLQNLDGSPANAADRLRRDLEATLTRLGVPRLEALLLHREGDLPAFSGALAPVFADFLRQGLVGRLGVSVYSPARCLEALASPLVGAIELPANILDRRFEREGVFELARRKGVALYLRSVFLQGLLVMPLAALPSRMAQAAPYLERLRRFAGISILLPLPPRFFLFGRPIRAVIFFSEPNGPTRCRTTRGFLPAPPRPLWSLWGKSSFTMFPKPCSTRPCGRRRPPEFHASARRTLL